MFDVDALLNPVSDGAPTGSDLRWVDGDPTFRSIEDNRVDEDPALVFEGEPKSANWRLVVATAEKALTETTKDLQLAVWLMEGLAALEGFRGIETGLILTHKLLDQFWDQLYPGFDPDSSDVNLATRAKPLSWLSSERGFIPAVKEVALANSNHTWKAYDRALMIEQAPAADQAELLADGGVSRAQWQAELQSIGQEGLTEIADSIRRCEEELAKLVSVCDERFGDDDSPHLTPLVDLFEEIREAVEPRTSSSSLEESAGEHGGALDAPAALAGGAPSGAIASRRDALQRLAAVAAYFRQTEPHSPMALLIDRAVRWGSMSFEQLFSEVVRNDSAQAQVWEILGVDPSNVDRVPLGQPPSSAPSDQNFPATTPSPDATPNDSNKNEDW